jgi:hypothetical protein
MFIVLVFSASIARGQPQPTTSATQQTRQQVLNFYLNRTVADYQRVGTRSPQWDADAQATLDALSRVLAWDFRPDGDEYDRIIESTRKLNEAGCSDPLVMFAQARAMVAFNRRFEDVMPLHAEAGKRIANSAYDPTIKCIVTLRGAWMRARDRSDPRTSRREGRRMVDAALENLPKSLADPELPTDIALNLFGMIGDASAVVERDRAIVFNRALPMLEQSRLGKPAIVLTARAEFALDYAMDAKHEATTSPQQMKQETSDRLNQAAELARQAWEADSSNARAADLMMQVESARGADDSVIEQWFERAIAADPSRRATYATRLRLLEPRNGGSIARMLELARRCMNNPDPDSGVSLLVVDTHLRAACFTEAGEKDSPQRAYFTASPQVFDDIRSVYEPFLLHHPDSLYHRSRYAQLATWCGQWQVSDNQVRAMNGQFSLLWFRSREGWSDFKAEVAEHIGR